VENDARNAPALKEWDVVVRALLAGEQILDVRKGGLHERDRHFGLRSTRCWLYPTFEHQRADLIKPAYRRWVDEGTDSGEVCIAGWVDIVGVARLADPDHVTALGSKLVWTDDYLATRLRWKRRDPLWVLVMRAHRLDQPRTIPVRAEYGGCSSWLDLADLPGDPSVLPAEPAVSDDSFAARLDLVARELPSGLESVEPTSAADAPWRGREAPP
jgi:hypothetical protein